MGSVVTENLGGGLRAQLVRGSAILIFFKGIALAAGFVVTVLLARLLGPSGYGVYTLVLSVVALLGVPAQLGVPTLVVREVAVAVEQRNWERLSGILSWSKRAVLALSIGVGITTVATVGVMRAGMAPDLPLTLVIGVVYLAISALLSLRQAVLQGLRQFALAQVSEMLLLPGLFVGCLAILKVTCNESATPALTLGAYAGCALVALITAWIFSRRSLPPQVTTAKPAFHGRAWISSALPLSMTSALTLVNSQVVVIMLGALSSTDSVGLYRVAASGAALATVVGATLGAIVCPYIATLHGRGDVVGLARLATYTAWLGALPAVAVLVAFLMAGGPILREVFGAHYESALPALIVLTAGQTINCATGVVHSLLNMTGHERDTLRGAALGAATSLLLAAALIPAFGLMGAALASATAIATENLYLLVRVRLRLNIHSSLFARRPA